MNYKGVIIEESLENKSVLSKVKILATKVEQVTKKHKTPYLKQWTLHTIEVEENKAGDIAQKISKSLNSVHNDWYADFKNDKFHYVIFKNKMFKINRSRLEDYKEAVEYGVSLGIPDYQLDFSKNYAVFINSFKLIIKKDNKILILTESSAGLLDLPGGRIEEKEVKLPIKELFKREIKEELGKDVKYEALKPVFQYRRYDKFRKIYIFITAYEAKYLSGSIKLSSEHDKYEWVDPGRYDLKKQKFDNPEERAAFEAYFNNFRK